MGGPGGVLVGRLYANAGIDALKALAKGREKGNYGKALDAMEEIIKKKFPDASQKRIPLPQFGSPGNLMDRAVRWNDFRYVLNKGQRYSQRLDNGGGAMMGDYIASFGNWLYNTERLQDYRDPDPPPKVKVRSE
jgi:hypothetical protein